MGKDLFVTDLTNLFIALSKGSVRLGPRAKKFSRDLGYRVFKFEANFQLFTGEGCSPDLILTSTVLGNTLVVEWTRNPNIDTKAKKQRQMDRYSRVQPSDLVNSAAVPVRAARTHDIMIVLEAGIHQAYIAYSAQEGLLLLLSSFKKVEQQNVLEKHAYTFLEPETEDFFTEPLEVGDIPSGYIPFSIQDIQAAELIENINNHLVSLIIKGEKRVTLDQFCRGYLAGRFNVYDRLGTQKKSELRNQTKAMKIISYHPKTAELLPIANRTQNTWGLLDRRSFQAKYASYYRGLISVVNQVKGAGTFQTSLFD